MEKIPRIGTEVMILKEGKFLLLKRTGSHGKGSWCTPGGWLEFGETPEDCVKREAREEAGIEIKNVKFVAITNDIFREEDKHCITIHFLADHESGEPRIMEPGKAEDIGWFEWGKLPEPLFLPMQNLLKQDFCPE